MVSLANKINFIRISNTPNVIIIIVGENQIIRIHIVQNENT